MSADRIPAGRGIAQLATVPDSERRDGMPTVKRTATAVRFQFTRRNLLTCVQYILHPGFSDALYKVIVQFFSFVHARAMC
jgi:hypothetical protein